MAGERADQGLPKLDDDDDVAESTIAMDSPSFDPVALGVSSPISESPLPLAASPVATPPTPGVVSPRGPYPSANTAPVPFAPTSSSGPAVPPSVGRPKVPSSPMLPTPLGGLVPRGPMGSEANPSALAPAAPPVRAGASTGALGGTARVRPQTVIGLAPPPPGAPRPGGPASPRPAPLPPPGGATPRAHAPDASERVSASKVESPSGADLPSWRDGEGERSKGSASSPDAAGQGLFGLDASAADAARAAAFGPGPRPGVAAPRSVLASTAYVPGLGAPPPPERSSPPSLMTPLPPGGDPEASTIALPRDQLRGPTPQLHRSPMLDPLPRFGEEEPSHATDRDGLPRLQDAHVVVGDGVGADDATLAVALGDNNARRNQLGAFAQTLPHEEPSPFRSSPGAFPAQHAQHGGQMGAPQNMGAPHQGGWNEPQQAWTPAGPQMRPMGAGHDRMSAPNSSPYLTAMPESVSSPGVSHHGHGVGPGQGMQMQPYPMHGQVSHHGQHGAQMMQGQPGGHWPAPAQGARRGRISGQIVLLAVVGVICLGIFVTGIVLFATTKF